MVVLWALQELSAVRTFPYQIEFFLWQYLTTWISIIMRNFCRTPHKPSNSFLSSTRLKRKCHYFMSVMFMVSIWQLFPLYSHEKEETALQLNCLQKIEVVGLYHGTSVSKLVMPALWPQFIYGVEVMAVVCDQFVVSATQLTKHISCLGRKLDTVWLVSARLACLQFLNDSLSFLH